MIRTMSGSRAARNIERLIALLAEAPRTHGAVMEHLHMSDRNATVYLSHLRNVTPKQVFVLRHDKVERGHSPVYALGDKPCAPRPPRQTMKQLSQKRRENWRKNPEVHDRYKAKERARKRVKDAVAAPPQSWFAALM